jgi:hypothetical protein
MVRKSTKVLEVLKEPIEPVLEPKKVEFVEVTPTPISTPIPMEVPPPPKKIKLEKNPLEEEIKKLNTLLRKQVNENKAFEQRMEGLVHRKFLEVKSLQKPVQNYRPIQSKPIRRYSPPEEEHRYVQPEEFEDYLTQEEEEEEPVQQNYNRPELQRAAVPPRNPMFSKIFG